MEELSDAQILAFLDELDKELETTSDRGLAVLALAGLDYLLLQLLMRRLSTNINHRQLMSGSGALSSLSAKITMCYALGLISHDERRELDLLRKVRNVFAHEAFDANFHTASVRDRCLELILAERLYAPPSIPFAQASNGQKYIPLDLERDENLPVVDLELPEKHEPRVRFMASTKALSRVLVARWTDIRGHIEQPAEFEHPEEPLEKMLEIRDEMETSLEELRRTERELVDELRERIETAKTAGQNTSELEGMLAELLERRSASVGRSQEEITPTELLRQVSRYSNAVIRKSRLKRDSQQEL